VKAAKAKVSALAHKLVTASYAGGEPSQERIGAVLALLRRQPEKERRELLRRYLALMQREEARRTLVIERAGPLDAASRQAIVSALTPRDGRRLVVVEKEAPELLGGIRARLGDDLYDASLSGILARLA
jgi:F-type H+-transporting ATPase subunit delta